MAQALNAKHFDTVEEAIAAYFSLGLSKDLWKVLGLRHATIQQFLRQYHGIDMSLRTLRRRLCELNLKRHNAASCSDAALREAVRREIATSGGSIGYRQVWHNLRIKHQIHVCRRKVSQRLLAPVRNCCC